MTYRYLHRFASTGGTTIFDPISGTPTVSGTGPADSHSLMFVVSHNWTCAAVGQLARDDPSLKSSSRSISLR